MRVLIGASAMVRAFGGPRRPLVIFDPEHYGMVASNHDDGQRTLQMAGQSPIYQWEPTRPINGCVHKFEECDFGRYARCMFCGFESRDQVRLEPRCLPGAELHHRTCALRLGAASCTCGP